VNRVGKKPPSAVVNALRENLRRAFNERRFEDAQDILSHLQREDPLSAETRGLELELHLNLNRLAEADALARQLRRLFPQSGRIHFLAGKTAYRMKRYDEAESCFRESQRIYPNWRTQYWLGKTLTQSAQFDEAEALLLAARERTPLARLELGWLYERRNDLEAALREYEAFLAVHPEHGYASQQRLRIKARMMDPEALIEEVGSLAELGEDVPAALFPDYIRRLFETGQTLQAREQVAARMQSLDAKTGAQVAWACYRAKAYDLACMLFLAHLRRNLTYYKYLNALESAAARCDRVPQVLALYESLAGQAPQLYGRMKSLSRRSAGK